MYEAEHRDVADHQHYRERHQFDRDNPAREVMEKAGYPSCKLWDGDAKKWWRTTGAALSQHIDAK
jgi:hypothetical protein